MMQHDRLSSDRSINNPFQIWRDAIKKIEDGFQGPKEDFLKELLETISPESKKPILPDSLDDD